ncbi:mechanosensitive ion channel family protein [Virgisporangium aurantiacum]|uniref:Mechanosensitive ion channel protein MscS n=1 Tax=Virgisporangium aurantiacum TaxID=175570 RepID=A0A8J4E0P2_9ACTN|nr:mechanosensitive ion channel domain-containing protein [Virgisporangium aurantiacum]GIJ57940.1 mechanosensitive ion channel protein MscS [Virgisporangium aurantiacum]
MSDALLPIGVGLGILVAGFAVLWVLHLLLARIARRSPVAAAISRHGRKPAHLGVVLLACHATLNGLPAADWHEGARHVLYLADIAVLAWGAIAALMITMDLALSHFRTDVRDNRHARRVHTQISVIRRFGMAVFAVVAVGAMLLTFPAFRAAGASLLASAGIAGVIAGLAAQSLLSNVIAGMQIVFSEALHLDDVVVVEGEWGRIEEITLTYVVVRIWDDRRLVLPTSYFLTTPFENWTRTEAAVIGAVELDLDWSVPVESLRSELELAVKENERWDGRTCTLQVTGATGSFVRIRALVSAHDAPTLWDLRCDVRERLVEWIRLEHPTALPRLRAEVAAPEPLRLEAPRARDERLSSGGGPDAESD